MVSHTSSNASNPQRTHVRLSKLVSWSPVSLGLKQGWSNCPRWRKTIKFWGNVLHRNSFSSLFSFSQHLIRQGFAKQDFVHTFAYIARTLLWTMRLLGYCCWLQISGASAETAMEIVSFDRAVRYWSSCSSWCGPLCKTECSHEWVD